MCSCVYAGNENSENGLNRFFFENKDFLPFSFVQLVMVPVHSSYGFCTIIPIFFTDAIMFLYIWFIFLFNCNSCTVAYYLCTIAPVLLTLALFPCTNGCGLIDRL